MQPFKAPPPLAKRRPDVPVEVLAARTLSLGGLELRHLGPRLARRFIHQRASA
jgi:hypothetical protein